ncbi:MAG: SDR family oxidoreductase [Deltaproteobacteria bacterium]|nr:SDR family oxidoreductase [Deltaproteobacteria bacterium]
MKDLEGKVVLVTGGGQGIGRAIAFAFALQGSRVVISGRRKEILDAAVEEFRRDDLQVLALACDITQKNQVEALDRQIQGQLGPVQILVNNAGMAPAVSFLSMEDKLWEEVLKVNLNGTYNCCKVFLPAMVAARWGRIINIASIVAKVSYSHISAYASSKHAVLGLTRSLAVEFARSGVTVNAICPGYVDTELTRENIRLMAEKTGKSAEDVLGRFKATSPQNRLISPDEIAHLAIALACDRARGITGQAINVDGGAVLA